MSRRGSCLIESRYETANEFSSLGEDALRGVQGPESPTGDYGSASGGILGTDKNLGDYKPIEPNGDGRHKRRVRQSLCYGTLGEPVVSSGLDKLPDGDERDV